MVFEFFDQLNAIQLPANFRVFMLLALVVNVESRERIEHRFGCLVYYFFYHLELEFSPCSEHPVVTTQRILRLRLPRQ